jgi:pantoate--beta-alanine ligase
VERGGRVELSENGLRPDYFSVRRARDLHAATPQDADLVVLAAAHLGKARLIDNLRVTVE